MKLKLESLRSAIRNVLLEAEGDEESVDDIVGKLDADTDQGQEDQGQEPAEEESEENKFVDDDSNVLEGSIDEQVDEYFSKYEEDSYESEKFDPTKFATLVARLVRNGSNVLDLEGAIKNRAVSFVKSNYSHEVASKVEQSLQKLTGKFKDYDHIPPLAKGAGPDIGTT